MFECLQNWKVFFRAKKKFSSPSNELQSAAAKHTTNAFACFDGVQRSPRHPDHIVCLAHDTRNNAHILPVLQATQSKVSKNDEIFAVLDDMLVVLCFISVRLMVECVAAINLKIKA